MRASVYFSLGPARFRFCLAAVIVLVLFHQRHATAAVDASIKVMDLRCEYLINPAGLDIPAPRLSWTLDSDQRAERQTAYQVLVASSPERLSRHLGDLWNSGKIKSGETLHIPYDGKPLASRMTVWWKVRAWDADGQPSAWSEPASWSMGLMKPADWQAKWIADSGQSTNLAVRGPLNGYHSEMVNRPDLVKWVVIDLAKQETPDAIRLFPARPYDWQPDTPGFLFPLRFKVEVANKADLSDAHPVIDRTGEDEPNPGTNAPVYRFQASPARFVRLSVTSLRPRDGTNFGFALAEMQVLHGGTNVALGCKVTPLDSIETGPWSKNNLTDGITSTVGAGPSLPPLPATMVRKTFKIAKDVRRATAYATALGLYELRINGRKAGSQLLAPEWTSYRKRVQYQTFDVTGLLHPGDNAVGAFLGEGWYAGRLMAVGRFPYGSFPQFLLQLEIEMADGSRQTIVSDESWQSTTEGPIRSAGIYDGETCDARKELKGWDAPGYNASDWHAVKTFLRDDRRLVWQRNEPIKIEQELRPVQISSPKPGVWVFDLGQNMVGWCRIHADAVAGSTVTIRHAEMLNDDGTLYTANLRGAPQVDHYTAGKDGDFTYEPRFTYHGFRYVELSGISAPPPPDAVIGRVFHSSSRIVGRFECSDSSLNQLMRNILWTQRGNLMSSPNDCPQRDERFGWMGDIQSFAQTAIFNMDMAAFFTKWLQDIRDDQADDGRFPDFAPHPGNPNAQFSGAPAWADAGVIVPWRAYQNYGDKSILAQQFDAARRWVDYVHQLNPDLVWVKGRNNDYNDWLNGDWVKQKDWPSKGGSIPNEVFATAFFAHSTDLVAKMAERLGNRAQAKAYRTLFEKIRVVFNERFVFADGVIKGDTQAGYALALSFDLLPEQLRAGAAERLAEGIRRYRGHLSTGIQTTHRAMLELSRYGRHDLAWQVLTDRTFPSWLYMLDNGASTIWERWDGFVKGRGFQDAGMNSFNHWAFGAVGEWMWRYIAGLNPDDAQPGWKHFTIAPRPGGGVTWANAEYLSVRGRIISRWRLDERVFTLEVVVPANTTATIILPVENPASVTEGGEPIKEVPEVHFLGTAKGGAAFEVGSGQYRFVCPAAKL